VAGTAGAVLGERGQEGDGVKTKFARLCETPLAALPSNAPEARTYEEAVCRAIARTVVPETPIQRILLSYWQQVRCQDCGQYGGSCGHRDRRRDLARVLRFTGKGTMETV
jgi:hypothetical protein